MKNDYYDIYLKLQEVCLTNSERFLKDALILKKNHSFGHAYSLAVLGFEELSKFWFAFYLFFSYYDEKNNDLKVGFRNHISKQMYGWDVIASNIFMEWLEEATQNEQITLLLDDLRRGKIGYKKYEKLIYEIVQEESNKSEIANNILELDRIVKQFFKRESSNCICPPDFPICQCHHQAQLQILTDKPVTPSLKETEQNPRSRSAKLRAAQKI